MATDAAPHVTRAERAHYLRGIYVIVNDAPNALALAEAALRAGVRVVQYRAKNGPDAARLAQLRAMTRDRGGLLILNDRWRFALQTGCDGVHLGPGDEGFDDPNSVRAAAPDLLVGLSCATRSEVDAAAAADVDYLGVGSVFATTSKDDAGAPIGIGALKRLAARTALPVAAIGGIDSSNLADVRQSGVAMAAVIGALAAADDPQRAADELVAIWNADAKSV